MNWSEFKKNIKNLNKSETDKLLNEFKDKLNNTSTREVANEYDVHHTTILKFANKHGLIFNKDNNIWVFKRTNMTDNKTELAGIKEGKVKEKIKKVDRGEYWIITDGKDKFPISKSKYRAIRRDYCDPQGRQSMYLKIPEIRKKYKINNKHFLMLQRAFGFIHHDIPYTDEEIEEYGVDPLVKDHLENEKSEFFNKIEEHGMRRIIKENEKYKKKEFFIDKIHDLVSSHFLEFAQIYKPPTINKPNPKNNPEHMLEVSIVDLHLNKLAWHPETGESYDTQIASKRFMYIINDIVNRVYDEKDSIKKIIFPIGNDFFNFDDAEGKTTKGTMQRNDKRWQDMYLVGQELLIKGIDLLRQIAPVKVFLVPGNHDWLTSFHAIININSWYRQEDDVEVDINPASRKYVRFGKNLIGFTHLDKEKKRIYGCMQVEARKDWGETIYHEWHGAHLHSELTKEDQGVIVRNLSSVTGRDDWHFNKGYLGHPKNQAFLWHKDKGLRNIYNTEIDLSEEFTNQKNRITI